MLQCKHAYGGPFGTQHPVSPQCTDTQLTRPSALCPPCAPHPTHPLRQMGTITEGKLTAEDRKSWDKILGVVKVVAEGVYAARDSVAAGASA